MRHLKHCFFISFLVGICALSMGACAPKTSENSTPTDEAQPVPVSEALFHNRDSINYYAKQAYLHEDPKGLFVMGVAARLREEGTLPDYITTVPLDEADIMLLRSAELGYQPALDLIHCLSENGEWKHSIPENK